jgi:hypothetical protein
MSRFAPLLLVVLALAAAVPVVAFADDSTPPAAATTTTTSSTPAAPPAKGHPLAPMRLEILRLRLQLVHLRYRIVCRQQSDACTRLTQKIVDRLTTLDQNVEAKLTQLGCSSASTDSKCSALGRVDAKLQKAIAKLGSGSPASSDESGLDSAANTLGGLNG